MVDMTHYHYPLTLAVVEEAHVFVATGAARALAHRLGFPLLERTALTTALHEIALNIVKYAGQGEVVLSFEHDDQGSTITVTARDSGPGIADLDLALTDGFSTGGTLGLGLPGAKRLMDAFEIRSLVGSGTTIIMQKVHRDPVSH